MIGDIAFSLIAGFAAWLVVDLVAEALMPRLMDPSVTQRADRPMGARVVDCLAIGVGVVAAIVVFVVRGG